MENRYERDGPNDSCATDLNRTQISIVNAIRRRYFVIYGVKKNASTIFEIDKPFLILDPAINGPSEIQGQPNDKPCRFQTTPLVGIF